MIALQTNISLPIEEKEKNFLVDHHAFLGSRAFRVSFAGALKAQ